MKLLSCYISQGSSIFGYPILFMAHGIFIMILWKQLPIPELIFASFANLCNQAESFPIFLMMVVTIACGAVTGFHATQSPLMARCITHERYGRMLFYGAMTVEALVALIWAATGMAFGVGFIGK